MDGPKQRSKVLIVAHADGYVQVFADKLTDIKCVVCPYLATQAGEVVAEDFIEQQLPQNFRNLYYPGYVRATTFVQPITPVDIVNSQYDRDVAKGVKVIQANQGKGAA